MRGEGQGMAARFEMTISCAARYSAAGTKLKNSSSGTERPSRPLPVAAGRLAQQSTAPMA